MHFIVTQFHVLETRSTNVVILSDMNLTYAFLFLTYNISVAAARGSSPVMFGPTTSADSGFQGPRTMKFRCYGLLCAAM